MSNIWGNISGGILFENKSGTFSNLVVSNHKNAIIRVKKIVVEHLGIDESKDLETASFIDDLGADSLDTVELVMAFEEEFDCEIPDDAAEKIQTVKDAIDFLKENSK